jgi:hypothetical protein
VDGVMADPFEQFHALYEQGLAVGHAAIKTDTMVFSFRDEVFEFPGEVVQPIAKFNGYFYTVPVDKLRKLKASG